MNPLIEICQEVDKVLHGYPNMHVVMHLIKAEIARIPQSEEHLMHIVKGCLGAVAMKETR